VVYGSSRLNALPSIKKKTLENNKYVKKTKKRSIYFLERVCLFRYRSLLRTNKEYWQRQDVSWKFMGHATGQSTRPRYACSASRLRWLHASLFIPPCKILAHPNPNELSPSTHGFPTILMYLLCTKPLSYFRWVTFPSLDTLRSLHNLESTKFLLVVPNWKTPLRRWWRYCSLV